MFWEDYNEPSFYKHIRKSDNFMYLNSKNVIYPCVADIMLKYLEENEENFDKLKKNSSKTGKYSSSSIPVFLPRSIVLCKNEVYI